MSESPDPPTGATFCFHDAASLFSASRRMHRSDTPPVESSAADSVWMTKVELAAVRRISTASADRLIRRQGWRKERGNDGRARVLVPRIWAEPRWTNPTDSPRANPTDAASNPRDSDRAIAVLEVALGALREETEQSRSWAAAERVRAERAEASRDEERARADALQDRIEGLRMRYVALEAEARAAHDRAWASGETAGALREQLAAAEQRISAERERAERAESRATHERQDFLDAESQTRREFETARKRADQAEQGRDAAAREADQARRDAQDAARTIEALRLADAARRSSGFLARLRRAWRGE